MKPNILISGEAGQGPNVISNILGKVLSKKGYFVFSSRYYESRIRGGDNFNLITISDEPVNSNDSKFDLIVAMNPKSEGIHNKKLKKEGKIIVSQGKESNFYFLGNLLKILDLDCKKLKKDLNSEKFREVERGYKEGDKKFAFKEKSRKNYFMNGSQGISEGAIKSGLDLYYAYPMTPSTGILNELTKKQKEGNILAIELEDEISVVNTAVGSSITGAKVMIGSSGGGFDLMSEGLSLAGMAEIPLVIYLASRPGPSTGVPTATAQEDLNLALNAGHGNFPRIVVAPGDSKEAQELTSQCFYLSQKYKTPSIILSDKHLAESYYTFQENPKIKKSGKLVQLKKYSGNEIDSERLTTFDSEILKKNTEYRIKKEKDIAKEISKLDSYKIYGNKKSKNIIVGWGSTKGAILDSIKNLDVKFVQILYINPFPEKVVKELRGNLILIENNSNGQLGKLIAEKTGIMIKDKNKILKYDGMPFFADELKEEISRRLR